MQGRSAAGARVPRLGLGLLFLLVPIAFGNSASTTQTLNPQLGAIGKVSVVTSPLTLLHTGTTFASFTGSDSINFKVRTTVSTGSGSLQVKTTTDFTGSGPKVANSDLTYTCSGSNFTPCSSAQTLSTTSQTNVVTMGAGACVGTGCTGTDPSTVTTNFTLTDNPTFKTGSYSATLTFSFSLL